MGFSSAMFLNMGEPLTIILGLLFLALVTYKANDIMETLRYKPFFKWQRMLYYSLFKYIECGFLIMMVSLFLDFGSNLNDEEFRLVS